MALAPSTSVGNYSNYLIFLKPFFPMIGRALSALGFTVILSNENLSQVVILISTQPTSKPLPRSLFPNSIR